MYAPHYSARTMRRGADRPTLNHRRPTPRLVCCCSVRSPPDYRRSTSYASGVNGIPGRGHSPLTGGLTASVPTCHNANYLMRTCLSPSASDVCRCAFLTARIPERPGRANGADQYKRWNKRYADNRSDDEGEPLDCHSRSLLRMGGAIRCSTYAARAAPEAVLVAVLRRHRVVAGPASLRPAYAPAGGRLVVHAHCPPCVASSSPAPPWARRQLSASLTHEAVDLSGLQPAVLRYPGSVLPSLDRSIGGRSELAVYGSATEAHCIQLVLHGAALRRCQIVHSS